MVGGVLAMTYKVKVLELAKEPPPRHVDWRAVELKQLTFEVVARNVDQARRMARAHVEKDLKRSIRGINCTTDGGLSVVVHS